LITEEENPTTTIAVYWDMQIYQVKQENTIEDNFQLSLKG